MRRSKKLIVAAVLATVLVVGSIGGIALAQENGDGSTLWDRAAAILQDEGVTVTSDQLEDAFAEARSEMRAAAMESRLAKLVADEKITQAQAEEYLKWSESRPDVPIRLGFRGHGGFRGFGGPCAPAE